MYLNHRFRMLEKQPDFFEYFLYGDLKNNEYAIKTT